jgi:iron complex outermembrane receptor protein
MLQREMRPDHFGGATMLHTIPRRLARRSTLLAASALCAVLAGAAHAETAASASDEGTEASLNALAEVVVTAQKRETNLQRTPIAISVASGTDLEARRVQSLADLGDGAIPSLRVAPFFSRRSALTVGIRGIVPFDANQPSRDAGVGVYIDGVYLGRSQGLGAALYDIERIEVLKGPQGTLFGRNSTGGAVSIVTKAPSGEFRLKQTVGASNFEGYTSKTHLDLPTFANISLKFDAIFTKRGGTIDNPMSGEADYNSFDRRGFHARVLWRPTDNFSLDYGFDVTKDATTPYYVQILNRTSTTAAPLAPAVRIQPDRAKTADIGVPQEDSVGNIFGHALAMTWSPMETLEFKSISSYRKLKQTQFDNGGAHSRAFVPNGTFARYSLAGMHQEQYSQEFQIVGSLPSLTYVAGAYYFHEEGDDFAWTPNTLRWNATGTAYTRLGSLIEGQITPYPDRFSTAKAESLAVFGQATWTPPVLDERLHLTVGARWTKDDKSGVLSKVEGADRNLRFDFKSDRIDPAVTIAWDATDALHLYAKWGQAYRAGGANARSLTYRSFGPEEVQTVEAGLKAEFLDRRARLNLAAYSTRYTDVQIDFNRLTFVGGRNIGTIETVNAPGTAKIKGFEADLTVKPIDGLTLNAAYAYTDAKFPRAPNPFAGNALTTVYTTYTPEHAWSASLDYERPMGEARLVFHIDANGAGGYHALSSEVTLTEDSFIVNGRVAVADIPLQNRARLTVSLWSRNLFNEEHVFVVLANSALGGLTGIYNEPRTYGLDATIEF